MRGAAAALFLILPPILLAASGWRHLQDGANVDGAIPLTEYLARGLPLPRAFYASAQQALDRADSANGDAVILSAEAALHKGAAPSVLVMKLRQGLRLSPANARGWLLLAGALRTSDPKAAATALMQSILLSHFDYWLAGPRAAVIADLYPTLQGDDRTMAEQQIRLLWDEPSLRPNIPALLSSPQGVAVFRAVFLSQPDELRAVNRWISQQQRDAMRQGHA